MTIGHFIDIFFWFFFPLNHNTVYPLYGHTFANIPVHKLLWILVWFRVDPLTPIRGNRNATTYKDILDYSLEKAPFRAST